MRRMKTMLGPVVVDGDQCFIAVPERRTIALYNYLRGFGYSFTLECRGFCEDNVILFAEGEDLGRLNSILAAFALD